MLFSMYKTQRMAELIREEWGDLRVPDLLEVLGVARPRSVLEVGCYRGVSTEIWALHCQHVVAVDPWPELAVYKQFMARVSHYPNVEMHRCRSLEVDVPTEGFDLVYLDGDHSYECVTAELIKFLQFTNDGGFIGGHDYTDTPAPGDGVKRAVDEMFKGPPPFVFSDGSWLVQIKGE